MGRGDIEQTESSGETLATLRRELEGKIKNLEDKLEPRIEGKVSNHVFYWIAGAILAVIAVVFTYASKVSDREDAASTRITVIETRMDKPPNSN